MTGIHSRAVNLEAVTKLRHDSLNQMVNWHLGKSITFN